ncbi:hypothetical protein SAMN05216244_0801 [Sediminibacillus halophilus]|uniref:Uncharacterized protein n=2 Tax=Sediminibacillus halophilus TaxID=482461 RepID=A0A1G9N0F1_9BACI|nr:hypothetical protein SAMN05216244_0801 [Sediminibacillus halophilus]
MNKTSLMAGKVLTMGNLIDFDQKRTKKRMKELAQSKGIVYEIYLIVVKYVYKYADKERVDASDFLTTEASLSYLFAGDRNKFRQAYDELMRYWDLTNVYNRDVMEGKEFQQFNTIGDLCFYIEEKVNKQKGL